MNKSRLFESVILENISFPECFYKLLNDISDCCKLLEKFLCNERLIENFDVYREIEENLISTFQEKIDNIDFDINLIKSKIKSRLSNIEEQNEQINSLLHNVLLIDSAYFRNTENKKDKQKKEQAKPLYDKMREGLNTLEYVISEYNKKAEKNKSKKLITIEKARENAIQELRLYLDSVKSTKK
jgi:hypothetical protein